MKKQKYFIPILSILMMGMVAACSHSSDSSLNEHNYPVYTGTEHHLTYQKTEDFISTYKDGDFFCPTGLNVFFDDTELTSEQYYFTTDNQNPGNAVLTDVDYMISPKQNTVVTYYVAFDQDGYSYVSDGIDVTVNNPVAVESWVYYTVIGAILVAIGIWSFVRAKAKKEGRV